SHGIATVIDPTTGEILAEQTFDITRDYQRRTRTPTVNHAPTHPSTMPQDIPSTMPRHMRQLSAKTRQKTILALHGRFFPTFA
ncbi:hypothetical protein KIH79_12220, partial [Bifidobacterium sp. 82T10]